MLGSKECHLYYCISSCQWRQSQQPVIVCCLFSFSIPGVLFLRVAAAPALGGNARTLWDVLLKGSNAPAAVWPGVRSMPKWYGAPKRPIYTQDGYILTEMNHSECQPPPPLTHTPTLLDWNEFSSMYETLWLLQIHIFLYFSLNIYLL